MSGLWSGAVRTALGLGVVALAALGLTVGAFASGSGAGGRVYPAGLDAPVPAGALAGFKTVDVTAALPASAKVVFVAGGRGGAVLDQIACRPSGSGTYTCPLPAPGPAGVLEWVAVDPGPIDLGSGDSADAMGLTLLPPGRQPSGTPITAQVSGVPISGGSGGRAGEGVFLVGVGGTNPDGPSVAVKILTFCATDQSFSASAKATTATCTFKAPGDYQSATYSFEAHTTGDLESVPVNNLPEAPYAAALPLAMIGAGWLLRSRVAGETQQRTGT